MRTEKFYAAFSVDFMDLVHNKPVHEGKDGMIIAMRDILPAQELFDKLKQIDGRQLSAYGCGPEGDQHVYLPSCAGIAHLKVPVGVIKEDAQAIDISKHPEWVTQVTINVSGDVSHGPFNWTQLTMDLTPDYSDVSKLMAARFEDLSRIAAKLAVVPDDVRKAADLYDDFARDSLRALYNGNGFMTKRVHVSNPTEEKIALGWGLEYLQTYMKALEQNMSLDFMLRTAHDMEASFKEQFQEQYTPEVDYRITAAATMHKMLESMSGSCTNLDDSAVLALITNQAERDTTTYSETPIGETPDVVLDEPEEEI